MKEIKQKFADKIEIVKQVSIEKQNVKIGTLKPQKNHKMFEVNMILKTITAATYDDPPAIKFSDAQIGVKSASKKITVNQDCVYISALNTKNVKKIIKRDFKVNF
jgi:hypothetical protein